jgi:dTDP-4-amino-4,6-dideoxygalactose transaminase
VHCYGTPCDVERIQEIASKHQLKVIYDAAHSFGVQANAQSLLNYGDLSILSFHATKIFNTFEGGAIISHSPEMKRRIDQLKNFGFVDEVTVVESGINGKMSEVNAAFGLLQLKHAKKVLSERQQVAHFYNQSLQNVDGIVIPQNNLSDDSNHSYYPILVDQNFPISRDQLYEKLKSNGIFSRRYFYPLISEFPMYRNFPSSVVSNLPVATKIANEVLCLPIYPGLSVDSISKIIQIIKTSAE